MTTITEQGLNGAKAAYTAVTIALNCRNGSKTKGEIRDLEVRIHRLKTIQRATGTPNQEVIERLTSRLKEKRASYLSTCLSTAKIALGAIPNTLTKAAADLLNAGYLATKSIEHLESARSENATSPLDQTAAALHALATIAQVGCLASQALESEESEQSFYQAQMLLITTNSALSAYSFAKGFFS